MAAYYAQAFLASFVSDPMFLPPAQQGVTTCHESDRVGGNDVAEAPCPV